MWKRNQLLSVYLVCMVSLIDRILSRMDYQNLLEMLSDMYRIYCMPDAGGSHYEYYCVPRDGTISILRSIYRINLIELRTLSTLNMYLSKEDEGIHFDRCLCL